MERTRMYIKSAFPHYRCAISPITYDPIDVLHAIAEFYFPRTITRKCLVKCKSMIRFSHDSDGETILELYARHKKCYEIMTHYDGSKRKAQLINQVFIRAKLWIDKHPVVNRELLEAMESIFCVRIRCSSSEVLDYETDTLPYYSPKNSKELPLLSLHLVVTYERKLETFKFEDNEEEVKGALTMYKQDDPIHHFLYLNQ